MLVGDSSQPSRGIEVILPISFSHRTVLTTKIETSNTTPTRSAFPDIYV
jgi:hypothetical protein